MRLKLIACEVLYRELCAAVARSVNQVDLEFLPKGLHDKGVARMLARLQEALDQTETGSYDAVLFGYALCGNGLVGLTARSLPVIVPRAHDCITLFFGSRERYLEYFENHPGVDQIIPYAKGRGFRRDLAEMLRVIRVVGRLKFDLAVLFQNAFEAALLAYLAGVPLRV